MMYCERCNIDFSEGLRYCKWCGQTLVERRRNTSELPTCPNCSSAVQPKWAFCKVCGVRLSSTPREPVSPACPQCGTKTGADALHCLNCGYHLHANDEAPGEAPSTSIIALCPTCGERIDPGSVYCKGCGAALYEQQTPFGQSAIICTACQSFNPVGSTACRVCGAALTVISATTDASQTPTRVVTEKESSTLPDLADHLPPGQLSDPRTPTGAGEGRPPYVTEERLSPPPAADFDSGAYTLTLDSQAAEPFKLPRREGFPEGPPPAAQSQAPPHPKGGETSLLPGVAGSKFEQPQPTVALNMGRDTGPVEDASAEAEAPAAPDEAPPARGFKPAPVTRLDSDGLAAHPPPQGHETFTFVSDVDAAAPQGTVALRTGSTPPTAFEGDPGPAPFVLHNEPAPPPPPIAPASDTDRIAAETTQAIPNAAPQTEAIADAARRFEPSQPSTMPIEQVAPPFGQSNIHYPAPPAPAAPAGRRKGRTGLIVGLVVALFALGLAGGGAWYLFGRKVTKPPATVTTTEPPAEAPKTAEAPKPVAPVAPEGMVLVPAGAYTIGRDDESDLEKPRRTVTLPAYFMDRTEVTNEAYKKFVDETGHAPPANWPGRDFPTGRANYPVTGITWKDAADYAAWAGKRLPTEVEWEAAARGVEGHRYPWGDEWLPGQANIGVKAGEPAKDNQYPPQITEVGGYPQGASPAGVLDLIGNVWEYTADEFKLYPGNTQTLDEVAVKLKIPIEPGVTYRVIRGGAFDGSAQNDASYRGFVNASRAFPKTGFRCVKEVK
jgi:formylglycine-generating enzyme required for sulfatase activity